MLHRQRWRRESSCEMMSRLLTLQRSAEIERIMRAYNGTNPSGSYAPPRTVVGRLPSVLR